MLKNNIDVDTDVMESAGDSSHTNSQLSVNRS